MDAWRPTDLARRNKVPIGMHSKGANIIRVSMIVALAMGRGIVHDAKRCGGICNLWLLIDALGSAPGGL